MPASLAVPTNLKGVVARHKRPLRPCQSTLKLADLWKLVENDLPPLCVSFCFGSGSGFGASAALAGELLAEDWACIFIEQAPVTISDISKLARFMRTSVQALLPGSQKYAFESLDRGSVEQ